MPLSARVPRPKTSPPCGLSGPRGGPRAALGRESHGGRRAEERPGSPGARDAARRLRRLRRPDPKELTPSHEGRVKRFMVQAGSFISSQEEQISKIFELNERKELTAIVLWSHEC